MKQHRMVEEFIQLATTDAPSRQERKIADLLLEKLQQLGFSAREDDVAEKMGGNAGNVIGVLPGTKEGHILFCAHMDRVEPSCGVKPIVHEDGTITSDGTTILAGDDLCGVTAILEGIRQVLESGQPYPTIEVVFTVCEEVSLLGSRNLDYSQLKSKIGYVLDTSGKVGRIVGGAPYKGMLTLTVHGKASHAGNYPEKGVNAIMALAHILDGIPEGRLSATATSNFGLIRGGENTGTVCDLAYVKAEVRNHSKEGLMNYYEMVKKHCEEKIKDTAATLDVDFVIDYDGFLVKEEEPTLKRLLGVLDDMGIAPSVQLGMGGMDANNFNSHGIRSVGVAAGYLDPHALYEKIMIEELIKAGEVVRRLILADE